MMNKRTKALLLTAALTTVSALTGCGQKPAETAPQEKTQESASEPAADTEETASDREGSDLFRAMKTVDLDGNTVDSSVFAEQKITLVNTWSTGCSPCVQELPHLGRLNREYADKGAAIKGLYFTYDKELSEQERADIEELTQKAQADYQQLLISPEMQENETMKNLLAFPTTYIVDSEGTIIATLQGSNDYEGWKAVIDTVLEKVSADE